MHVDMSFFVNGFHVRSGHDWAPFVLVVAIALFMAPVFIYFFQMFSNFCVQICRLGLRVGFRSWFRFRTYV